MDGWTIRVLWHFEHADSGYIMPQFKQKRLETVQEFWQMTLKIYTIYQYIMFYS